MNLHCEGHIGTACVENALPEAPEQVRGGLSGGSGVLEGAAGLATCPRAEAGSGEKLTRSRDFMTCVLQEELCPPRPPTAPRKFIC